MIGAHGIERDLAPDGRLAQLPEEKGALASRSSPPPRPDSRIYVHYWWG